MTCFVYFVLGAVGTILVLAVISIIGHIIIGLGEMNEDEPRRKK